MLQNACIPTPSSHFIFRKAHLAQLVGADQAEHNIVDAHAFLEGLCGECLEEHETTKAVTLEDIAQTEAEALNLVSRTKKCRTRITHFTTNQQPRR